MESSVGMESTISDMLSTVLMAATTGADDNFTTTATPRKMYDYTAIKWFYFVAMGVVIFVGLVCNILSVVVFFSSVGLRKTTTGHYLIALMFADTSFLIGELLRWLNYDIDYKFVLGLSFSETNDVACRLTYTIRYAAKLVSAWITVVITTERFLTVFVPLKVSSISTVFVARITIGVVTVVCCALAAFPLWTVGVGWYGDVTYCLVSDYVAYEHWNMAILRVGSLFLPSVIIFVLTSVIIVTLRRASRQRKRMGQSQGRGFEGQLTAMLIAVAIAFLVLRIPYTVIWYVNQYYDDLGITRDQRYYIYSTRFVADVLATANYATNFFLFCLCGSSFREQLRRMFGGRGRNRRSLSVQTHSTQMATSRSSSIQGMGMATHPNGYLSSNKV